MPIDNPQQDNCYKKFQQTKRLPFFLNSFLLFPCPTHPLIIIPKRTIRCVVSC